MTRSELTRRAVLFTFAAVMGKFNILSAAQRKTPTSSTSQAQLSVDLDQWGSIVFRHRGQSVTITIAEVFGALVANHPAR